VIITNFKYFFNRVSNFFIPLTGLICERRIVAAMGHGLKNKLLGTAGGFLKKLLVSGSVFTGIVKMPLAKEFS
jgi:hypothetical protein